MLYPLRMSLDTISKHPSSPIPTKSKGTIRSKSLPSYSIRGFGLSTAFRQAPFDKLRANVLVRVPFDKLRANVIVNVPFDRLGANVLVRVPFDRLRANVLVNVPFVLSLSKHLFGIVS